MTKKIINFGYNYYDELKDVIQGKEYYEGEYIDLLTINKKHYLFTKIISQTRDNKIDIREIIQNINADGSCIAYGNQEKSKECLGLEKLFNDKKIQKQIKAGAPIIYILNDLKIPVKRETLLNDINTIICVKPQLFESTRDLIMKYSDKSFLDLCRELEKAKTKQLSFYDNSKYKYGFIY